MYQMVHMWQSRRPSAAAPQDGVLVEITNTTVIDATIDRVWALTLDIEGLPAITPTVTSVERVDNGPLQVGSQARLRQPGLGRRIWTVEVIDEQRRFAWATRLAGIRMVGVHDLVATSDGRTELTLRVQFEGRGAGLLAKVGARNIAKALEQENAGFVRATATTTA